MNRTVAVLLILGLSALLLSGCGRAQDQPSIAIGCEAFQAEPRQVRQISLRAKDTLRVTLCANLSTGYSWEDAQISDPAVLEVTDEVYLMGERAKGLLGAPGAQVWTLHALQKGETSVAFTYSQPWQGGDKGAWELALQVRVE